MHGSGLDHLKITVIPHDPHLKRLTIQFEHEARASAMSSSPSQTTSDDAPTEIRLLAVTTRFAPPPDIDCNIKDLVQYDPEYNTNYYAYSDPLDPRFTACQPDGWADRPSSLRFSFSPAVCPSKWTWSRIQTATNEHNMTVTTAFCCAPGFSLDAEWDTERSMYTSRCSSSIRASKPLKGTFSHGAGSKSKLSSGTMAHAAWAITWQASDQARLTPAPPTLTGGTTAIASWDGKATSFPTTTDSPREHDLDGLQDVAMFVYIGLPLISLFLIGCCAWCCVHRWKDGKRRTPAVNDVYALRYSIQTQRQEDRSTNSETRV